MKKETKIKALFADLDAVSGKGAATQERFEANDELTRSIFGMSNASERELQHVIAKYKQFGKRTELLDEAIGQRKNASEKIKVLEAEYDELRSKITALVSAEAATLAEAVRLRLETVHDEVQQVLQPYFDEADLISIIARAKPVAGLQRDLGRLGTYNELPLLWAAVQEIDKKNNQKAV